MPTSESTYVWRRIRRDKVRLVLDVDGDWVADIKPDIEAARQWSEDNGFLWDEYAFTNELRAALGITENE